MLTFLRRWLTSDRPTGRPTRPICKPALEPLEDRATPANIAALGTALETATNIRLTYQASDVPLFQVGIYRSTDPVFSPDDVSVAAPATVRPRPSTGTQSAVIPLAREILIDPSRRFVLVVADPLGRVREANEADNTASFRKLALAVVSHGLQLDGQLPGWVGDMADGLRRAGFGDVIEFDWAAASRLPLPGQTVIAGIRLAQQVRTAADALGSRATDVVDVQFIGHSRGGVVISQALLKLAQYPGPRELRLGYYQMTLLDPHPARNAASRAAAYAELSNGTGVSMIGGFSFDPADPTSVAAARTTLLFQSVANDPLVTVPANVDKIELFYQRLSWDQTTTGGFESRTKLNIWGLRPTDLLNPFHRPIYSVDIGTTLAGARVGHTAVQSWYIDTYLPPGP